MNKILPIIIILPMITYGGLQYIVCVISIHMCVHTYTLT